MIIMMKIEDIINTIICEDTLEVLKTMPDGSVDSIITSPPYWGLRRYFFNGASVLRKDLTAEQKGEILKELEELGIRPKMEGEKK